MLMYAAGFVTVALFWDILCDLCGQLTKGRRSAPMRWMIFSQGVRAVLLFYLVEKLATESTEKGNLGRFSVLSVNSACTVQQAHVWLIFDFWRPE